MSAFCQSSREIQDGKLCSRRSFLRPWSQSSVAKFPKPIAPQGQPSGTPCGQRSGHHVGTVWPREDPIIPCVVKQDAFCLTGYYGKPNLRPLRAASRARSAPLRGNAQLQYDECPHPLTTRHRNIADDTDACSGLQASQVLHRRRDLNVRKFSNAAEHVGNRLLPPSQPSPNHLLRETQHGKTEIRAHPRRWSFPWMARSRATSAYDRPCWMSLLTGTNSNSRLKLRRCFMNLPSA